MDSNPSRQNRQLRVFISSTFTDMNAERDALTLIFPQIRELCTRRGIDFVPVDLRWGITENEAKEGRVLETCLREIEQSRPFFIGIIGERYGWTPTEAELGYTTESLKRQYPWLAEALSKGLSITEIEMQYGALSHSAKDIAAAFFIRRGNTVQEPERLDNDAGLKLRALKDRIRSQSDFEVRDYDSPEQLARLVLSVLTGFLKKEFPEQKVSFYDIAAARQQTILESKSKSLFDLSRHDSDWRQRTADSTCKWLSITGIKGSGKSHLLAHIVSQLREAQSRPAVIYVDCNSDSRGLQLSEYIFTEILHATETKSRRKSFRSKMAGNLRSMARHIVKFIALYLRPLSKHDDCGKTAEDVSLALVKAIEDFQIEPIRKVHKQLLKNLEKCLTRPVFVALDNMDALEPHVAIEIANLLNTLPHIRFITTASSGSPIQPHLINILKARYMSVGALTADQRREYITNYLARYGKRLDERGRQCDMLAKSNISGNPKLLSHILGLMVCFGSFEELDRYISELAVVKNEQHTYRILIRNLSGQFAANGYADIALNALGALAASPKGLTEEEIIDIFHPTPMAWAMVRPYILNLCDRRGRELFISSKQLVNAISHEIPAHLESSRQKVAHYFENLHRAAPDSVTGNITLFSQLRMRQAQILMPLYHAAGMASKLYDWATYIVGDIVITDRQRRLYWQMLFYGGYDMRSAPDPDYPPDYKRGLISAEEAGINKSPQKDLMDMYQRWSVVAGSLSRAEDSLWLSMQIAVGQNETERALFKNTIDAQTLYAAKKYDRLIAMESTPPIDEYSRIFTDLFIGMAYCAKQNPEKAYTAMTRAFDSAKSLGILCNHELIVLLCTYSELAYSLKEYSNRDSLISALEHHLSHLRLKGLNDFMLYRAAKSLAMLYSTKGLTEKALEAANLWKKSAAATGTTDHDADLFIAAIKTSANS